MIRMLMVTVMGNHTHTQKGQQSEIGCVMSLKRPGARTMTKSHTKAPTKTYYYINWLEAMKNT